MDLWGWCDTCGRWFYCGRANLAVTECPVCCSGASIVENRLRPPREEPDTVLVVSSPEPSLVPSGP